MKQPKEVGVTGRLWCHVGTKKDYTPQQCEAGVEECFMFQCSGGQHDFYVRGCGVSILTKATGLQNESCFQAQGVCQYLGGESDCETCHKRHMCNTTNSSNFSLLSIFSLLLFLFT
ncbi:unnamed protein product, partial [Mesorhabditis belari]|uniref:Uncharacterized protein n=1 Tax=Mesorhabditis belari TaxID=2138241 RepID=A0AAF3EU73_9BILA